MNEKSNDTTTENANTNANEEKMECFSPQWNLSKKYEILVIGIYDIHGILMQGCTAIYIMLGLCCII